MTIYVVGLVLVVNILMALFILLHPSVGNCLIKGLIHCKCLQNLTG